MRHSHRYSRMVKNSSLLLALLIALLLATSASCKKKPVAQPAEPPPAEAPPPPPAMPQEVVKEAPIQPVVEPKVEETDIDDTIRRQNQSKEFLKTVYFDFDRADIREDQAAVLQGNATWLKSHQQFRVLIEGHCDERDTIEYNLALGDRRAKRVLEYLRDLGVPSDRMRTISYGEERPVDPGHDEEAWGRNRRAEFVLEK